MGRGHLKGVGVGGVGSAPPPDGRGRLGGGHVERGLVLRIVVVVVETVRWRQLAVLVGRRRAHQVVGGVVRVVGWRGVTTLVVGVGHGRGLTTVVVHVEHGAK